MPPNTHSSAALGPGQAHQRFCLGRLHSERKDQAGSGVLTQQPGACTRPQVVFFLHPTFHNPVREVLQHPFEIEEHGWGEFELSVVVRACGSFKPGRARSWHGTRPVAARRWRGLLMCSPCAAKRVVRRP